MQRLARPLTSSSSSPSLPLQSSSPPSAFLPPHCLLWEGIISAAIRNLSPAIHCVSLSETVEWDEKCPPAGYMKVWNCRLLFALGRVPQKVFLLFIDRVGGFLVAAAAAAAAGPAAFLVQPWLLLFPGHLLSATATFSNFSGPCCMKQQASLLSVPPWEVYINLDTKGTRQIRLTPPPHFHALWATQIPIDAHTHPKPSPLQTQLHQMNNQIKVLVH